MDFDPINTNAYSAHQVRARRVVGPFYPAGTPVAELPSTYSLRNGNSSTAASAHSATMIASDSVPTQSSCATEPGKGLDTLPERNHRSDPSDRVFGRLYFNKSHHQNRVLIRHHRRFAVNFQTVF
jgi:hypothetical protein